MPMIDAYIPDGALEPAAERQLLKELTEILIRLEGFEPTNERARSATWIFLHRPRVFVAGIPAELPRYRIIASVPEGQYDDARRQAVTREVTEAISRAEGRTFDEVSRRVWVFPIEIPDGTWGARGRINRLPDIFAHLVGEYASQDGVRRLAQRRRENAIAVLDAARETAGANRHP